MRTSVLACIYFEEEWVSVISVLFKIYCVVAFSVGLEQGRAAVEEAGGGEGMGSLSLLALH